MNAYERARDAVDKAHAGDPKRSPEGLPAELVYADRVEAWVTKLVPEASPLLRLGARCQHLERWSVSRNSFPLDKEGYHSWRKSLYVKQAARARELLLSAGVSAAEADEVYAWVSKTGLRANAGTQALEDGACLVFLESEIGDFTQAHSDYPREKFVAILRRTWSKMSPSARIAALGLPLPPAISALVQEAVGDVP